ncbi:MAG TPA: FkbM family methyltransferase [Xanthobacteraceae bacterium]|jgi:FkbM family methyltransferase|nr:FkbM family methyltransferase [Xanthobacteraceae bacterium]
MPPLSYAQRFEDFYLMRCFGGQTDGFYIDIGSGHPVYDNVSFAFYLKGWRGITVEPNPWLSRLTRAVRPRDRHVEALVGSACGQATFYQVREFHGLSTMIADHARAALMQFGKAADASQVPLTTLSALCADVGAPPSFEFLKIDVEGAEPQVLKSGDWQRFRPKVVIVEALAPYTLAPAFDQWESFLVEHGYSYVWFDSLNRYYLAAEAAELRRGFMEAPTSFDAAQQFRNTRPALADPGHPDHALAVRLGSAMMTHLPVLDRALLLELLTHGLDPAELERRAAQADIERIWAELMGPQVGAAPAHLSAAADPTVRDVYAAVADSDLFRAACGRISASYGW